MRLIASVVSIAHATPALAFAGYIGPGLGASELATLLGLVVLVGLALFGVAYYPLKRLFGRKKKSGRTDADSAGDRRLPGE